MSQNMAGRDKMVGKSEHGPGLVKVSELAVHWSVCRDVAEAILARNQVVPAELGPKRYRWSDIWRLEGAGYVPTWDWGPLKAPLLKTEDLTLAGALGRSSRSIRRKAANGKLPTVNLGIDDWRFRRSEILHHFPDLQD